jgi:hypothetical protein
VYISYSGFKTYSSCPRAYWHSYVDKTVPPEPDNTVNSLYGSVVGTLMEDFYMKGLWREKNVQKVLEDRIDPTYKRIVSDELRRGRVLRWKSPQDKKPNYESQDELLADVRDTIARAIRIVRHYRLAGPRMEAESKLDSDIGEHRLGGRADFIIQRTSPHHDLVILDGKGSKHRGSFVDPKQLKWYAMLYSIRNKNTLPDKLGFVYWRFDPPESLDWVDFSQVELEELRDEVLTSLTKIVRGGQSKEAFPAKPSDQACRFCNFISLCPQGRKLMDARS